MEVLDKYYNEIEWTNRQIHSMSWDKYTKKFKKVNPELYKALCGVELRKVKNEGLRNWIKNLRSEK